MTTTLQPNTEQSAYIEAVKSGANTLLTGPGGVGKSYTLDCLRTHYGRGLSVVASTGIAALNIGGVTLHSWAGLGLGTDTARHIAKRLMDKKGKAFDKIIACRRMAIDEVSMISADLLTKTDEVLRIVRRCEDPFGGIQMLFVGDFCQLPPIVKIDSHKWNKNESGQTDLIPRTPEELATLAGPRFAFSSPSWAVAKVGVHELRTVMRQKDLHFVSMLNKVRRGVIDDEVRQTLDARVHAEDPNPEIKPVKLNGYNKAVESINAMELQKLPGKVETYAAEDSGIPAFIDMIKRNCIAPEFLNLKVDAQVMLLRNLDTENGLVNGAIGIVRDFAADGLPLVEFAGENIIKCEPKTWEYSSDGQVLASRTQVPLRLAWAWSIHKSQSQTMDKVEVDLTSVFEAGQAYVALSRCRTLEGLFLTGVDYEKIFADQQALAFYGYTK